MKSVAVVAGLLLVAVLVGVAASMVRRRRSDDVHSVEGYRQTLHTLQGIRSRPPLADRRVGGNRPEYLDYRGRPAPPDQGRPTARPDQGAQGEGEISGEEDASGEERHVAGPLIGAAPPAARRHATSGRRRMVFGEADAPSGPVPVGGTARGRSMAMMDRPPHRLGLPIAVVLIVAAVVVAVVLVALRHHHSPTASGSSTSSTTGRSHPTSTTTTQPARYTAVTSTSAGATYTPAVSDYSLQVGAPTGACWVSISSSTGSTVFVGTLTTGSSKTFTMTGKSSIVIGAPSVVAVSIDRVPVVLPAGAQSPFTVTISPGATG